MAKAAKDGISRLALTEANYDAATALLVTVCVFSSEPSVVASNTLLFLIRSDWQSLALNNHLLKNETHLYYACVQNS